MLISSFNFLVNPLLRIAIIKIKFQTNFYHVWITVTGRFLNYFYASFTTLCSSYSTKSFTIENKTSGVRYLTGESVSNYIPTTVQLSENVQKKKISQLYSENLFRKRVKEILYRAGGPITITTPLAVSVFAF